MSIRNILVTANGTDASDSAVRLALRLATQHDAHLTGLFAHALPAYIAHLDPYLSADAAAQVVANEERNAKLAAERFQDLVAEEGLNGRVRFLIERGQPDPIVARFARTYDLTVIGQPKGSSWEAHLEPHPDTVALQSGRPVMVCPRTLPDMAPDAEAVLAWDGKRAAARALSDAMGMLKDFSKLTVLHVGDDDADVRRPGCDIMEHLSRHDIAAELLIVPRAGRAIGDILLEIVSISGASLLIMGAYEHSKFSEQIFGGVTRDVLGASPVPILVSH